MRQTLVRIALLLASSSVVTAADVPFLRYGAPLARQLAQAPLAVAAPAAQPASVPRRTVPLAAAEPLATSARVVPQGDAIRADGPDWTATCDARGVTFTPMLGTRAPRTYPVRLATLVVARESALGRRAATSSAVARNAAAHDAAAGAVAPYAAAVPVRPVVKPGERVVYERHRGVRESWQARRDGLELTYTFAAPLPGTGDLVARLRLDTELQPVGIAGHGEDGLYLRAPAANGTSCGGVRLGAVTGIDAAGRRTRGTMRLRAGVLELRLPAAFVDAAEYPLVLDPLFGTEQTLANGADDASPDVAFEPQSQRWLCVWHRVFAIDRAEVWGQLLDAQGAPIGTPFVVRSLAAGVALRPRVAAVHARNRFVVTWCEAANALAYAQAMVRCVEPTGAMSALVAVPGWTFAPTDRPLLAGNTSPTDAAALLVFRTATHIWSRRLIVPSGLATPSVQGAVQIDDNTALTVDNARLVRNGGNGRWVVAWYAVVGLGYPTTQARVVGANGSPLGPVASLVQQAAPAAIDGDGSDFVLVHGTNATADLRCQRLQWTGSALAASGASHALTGDADAEREVAVARVGPKYLITWSDDGGNPLTSQIQGIAIDARTCVTCEPAFTIARPGRYDFDSSVAAGGAAGDEALIVFASAATTVPFAREVVAQRFSAFGKGGTLVSQGGGCGGSYAAASNGPIAIGNRGLSLKVTGVLGATSVYFSLGVPGPLTLPCGPCQVTPPLVIVPAKLGGGEASIPLPLRCDQSLVGNPLELQWWVFAPTPAPCPLVPGLSFSDRYHLTIGL